MMTTAVKSCASGFAYSATFILLLPLLSSSAMASGHAYYNDLRSYNRNMYFSSSIGFMAGTMAQESKKTNWRGYCVETGVGKELFKFLHLEVSHTMVSMTATESSSQHMSGSKINGKIKMSFRSPIGNLELGVGSHFGSYGYIANNQASDLASVGHQFGLGLNYFTSHNFSIQTQVVQSEERWSRASGTAFEGAAEAEVRSVLFGINLWR